MTEQPKDYPTPQQKEKKFLTRAVAIRWVLSVVLWLWIFETAPVSVAVFALLVLVGSEVNAFLQYISLLAAKTNDEIIEKITDSMKSLDSRIDETNNNMLKLVKALDATWDRTGDLDNRLRQVEEWKKDCNHESYTKQ